MLDSITIADVGGLVGIGAALLAGNAGLTSLLIDRKLKALNNVYVPIGECVLRTVGQEREAHANRDEARAACLVAAGRDEATQKRIDGVMQAIANSVLESREVQRGIAELLARK